MKNNSNGILTLFIIFAGEVTAVKKRKVNAIKGESLILK